ncbi:ROK family transcriptional regulator [Cohnella algarum]|uniref:ROK family transcriptional regulator n=1 Tax=Cohnella algarum TaxID=2044859 RepID=UPI001F0759AA|nr:ROK family transcriptional regulator [Cohnella algarum]
MPLKGNMEFVKELNRSLVIRRIRDDGPISRTELAAATELGLSTITYIVEELLADGLVREAGTASSSAGRKRVMLQFNNGRYFIAGAKIEESCIEFGVSDLNGTILERIQAEFAALPTESGPVNDIMIQSIRELSVPLREAGMECLGVGIAVSGLVDRSTLKVVSSPSCLGKTSNLRSYAKRWAFRSIWTMTRTCTPWRRSGSVTARGIQTLSR